MLNNDKKIHIDAQTWVLTKSEEYLPFLGIYNYTSPRLKYVYSSLNIDKDLEPEYLVAKIIYRDEENKTAEINYFVHKLETESNVS